MKNKTLKGLALATMVGTLFQLGGCINLNTLLRSAVYYAALEVVTDGDGFFGFGLGLTGGGTTTQ